MSIHAHDSDTGNINNPILRDILGIECQSTYMIASHETLNYPIHGIFRRIDHVQLLDR